MYKQLTSEQRYTISMLLQNRAKQKDVAMAINVSPSTVSREIRRNSGIRGRYNWEKAQANAIRTKRKKADALKISANTVKEILSEKDDTSGPMCGEVGPAPKDIDPCMFSNLESSDFDSIIVSSDANEEF